MTGLTAACFAAICIGICCGLLGTFVVARRMALTGDMVSHAVLPGVVAGLAWSTTRNPMLVLLMATLAGVLGTMLFTTLGRYSKLKPDAALAIVLSVFFAVGIAMISRMQPSGVQAFLYGQIAALDRSDMHLLSWVTATVVIMVPLGFRVLTLISFDPIFARLTGVSVRLLDVCFFILLTAVIVVAMQAVGVVLVTAMLVTPAAAARFCTHSLTKFAWIACGIGALCGLLGVWLSTLRADLPTGPLIALSAAGAFLIAGVFGPRQGWLHVRGRRRRERVRITAEDVLKWLWYHEAAGQELALAEHSLPLDRPVKPALKYLLKNHWVTQQQEQIELTPDGRNHASQLVRTHRLWERYLTEFAAYQSDHVHDEAERAEHWIDAAKRAELAEKLGDPEVDPHGQPIPPATTSDSFSS